MLETGFIANKTIINASLMIVFGFIFNFTIIAIAERL